MFTTLLDVDPGPAFALAVDEVFASYDGAAGADQVLVQPMVTDVSMHGVVFTRTLDRGAPYYVVNYDQSGDTEAITSGSSADSQTLVVHRGADFASLVPDPFRKVFAAVRELESLLHYDALDIEFAVDGDGGIHVFQVRPITVAWSDVGIDDTACDQALSRAVDTWERASRPPPFLPCGDAVFGVMPDWNPAEIIGTAPGALARSLYGFLVTDEIWATQRAEYGYRDVRPQQLLVSFAGRPYVDVRASFASFVPAEIDDGLAARLVAWYLRSLRARPELHDKVEFQIVPTCMALDFAWWRQRLEHDGGFSADEVEQLATALRRITVGAFHSWRGHMADIERLEARRPRILQAAGLSPLERARLLLEDCRRYGTLPFSHLARSAFVATTLLRSAVSEGIIPQAALDALMSGLSTVTSQFSTDVHSVAAGGLTFEALVARYGHLRPGTYDITSPCYGADPEVFLAPLVREAVDAPARREAEEDDSAWHTALPQLQKALRAADLPHEAEQVNDFFRSVIAGREYAKFCFSRNLSSALEEIAAFGKATGLDRNQLSNVPIAMLLDLNQEHPGAGTISMLEQTAATNLKLQQTAAACPMPPIITGPDDFACFTYASSQPNFVGTRRVRAHITRLAGADGRPADDGRLANSVVLIPQADPGYDWLFGQGIAGLVTMYGGANSHMAIRAAELGLPAAIGIGEGLYDRLSRARLIFLDPENQKIEGIYQ